MSPLSEARKRANENYLKTQEEIKIRVPKGEKGIISAHAKQQGESVNSFIIRAIKETMERDRSK